MRKILNRIKIELGKTGLKVPPIIFGTSALGNLYSELKEDVKLEIVKECFTYLQSPVVFDSAGKYGAGLALEILGKCLNQLNISSENVIISNKLGWQRISLTTPEPTFEKGIWINLQNDAKQSISYEGILTCWEQGNSLLGGKYLPQMVSVHDPDEYIARAINEKDRKKLYNDILEAYKALSFLKSQGKTMAVGVGSKDWRIIEQLSNDIELDWVMFANSMTIFRHPPELLSFMERINKQNIGIINSAVFNAGFLIGGDFFDYKKIQPDSFENKGIFKWREDFFRTCKKHSVEPYIACVHFGMTPPGVASISLNTSNPMRVKSNVESVVSEVPSAFYSEMKEKGLISKNYPYAGV